MTSHIADNLTAELMGSRAGATPAEESATLRLAQQAKQTRWRAMALACHRMGPLDENGEDVADMIKLMVRAEALAASLGRSQPSADSSWLGSSVLCNLHPALLM